MSQNGVPSKRGDTTISISSGNWRDLIQAKAKTPVNVFRLNSSIPADLEVSPDVLYTMLVAQAQNDGLEIAGWGREEDGIFTWVAFTAAGQGSHVSASHEQNAATILACVAQTGSGPNLQIHSHPQPLTSFSSGEDDGCQFDVIDALRETTDSGDMWFVIFTDITDSFVRRIRWKGEEIEFNEGHLLLGGMPLSSAKTVKMPSNAAKKAQPTTQTAAKSATTSTVVTTSTTRGGTKHTGSGTSSNRRHAYPQTFSTMPHIEVRQKLRVFTSRLAGKLDTPLDIGDFGALAVCTNMANEATDIERMRFTAAAREKYTSEQAQQLGAKFAADLVSNPLRAIFDLDAEDPLLAWLIFMGTTEVSGELTTGQLTRFLYIIAHIYTDRPMSEEEAAYVLQLWDMRYEFEEFCMALELEKVLCSIYPDMDDYYTSGLAIDLGLGILDSAGLDLDIAARHCPNSLYALQVFNVVYFESKNLANEFMAEAEKILGEEVWDQAKMRDFISKAADEAPDAVLEAMSQMPMRALFNMLKMAVGLKGQDQPDPAATQFIERFYCRTGKVLGSEVLYQVLGARNDEKEMTIANLRYALVALASLEDYNSYVKRLGYPSAKI